MRTPTKPVVDIRRMKRLPTHLGEMLLEEFLRPLGMSQADAARRMRISANRLNEMIRKKRVGLVPLRVLRGRPIPPDYTVTGRFSVGSGCPVTRV